MNLDLAALGPFSFLEPSLDILPLPPPRLVAEPRARDSPLNRGELEIVSPLPVGRPKKHHPVRVSHGELGVPLRTSRVALSPLFPRLGLLDMQYTRTHTHMHHSRRRSAVNSRARILPRDGSEPLPSIIAVLAAEIELKLPNENLLVTSHVGPPAIEFCQL